MPGSVSLRLSFSKSFAAMAVLGARRNLLVGAGELAGLWRLRRQAALRRRLRYAPGNARSCLFQSLAAFCSLGRQGFGYAKMGDGHPRAVDSRAIQASGAFRDGVLTPLIVRFGVLGRNRPSESSPSSLNNRGHLTSPSSLSGQAGIIICSIFLPQDSPRSTVLHDSV